ncbi:MAG TPA: hypothetical protein VKP67_09625 [Xanthobacteraceae bacterium]|nr:hypothetical protein [Xanthobacteraceae bacterium]
MATIGLDAPHGAITRTNGCTIDSETIAGAACLACALIIGIATAGDYGTTIDEFNTDDYGPKALAWYTSGFTDHSHFETVEFSLWYYGPWFQILTALAQSLGIANPLTVRHAMTFLVGLGGLAALLPIARFSVGRWAGMAALVLCLTTGYLYGNLFFAPIDVPFLAAMCWAILAIALMARQVVPGWTATVCAGLATGLAIATRTGGVITHCFLIATMFLSGVEALILNRHAAWTQLRAIAVRVAAAIAISWLTAIVLWPWLQIGNPFSQFKIAFVHFATLPLNFKFPHWGRDLWTNAPPWSYIPEQWLARLPIGFLCLLLLAALFALAEVRWLAGVSLERFKKQSVPGLRRPALMVARSRRILLVWMAVAAPVGFLMVQHATLYDGVRHILFVIPMLALVAGWGLVRLLPFLRRFRVLAVAFAGGYIAVAIANLVTLHPLEYIATNAFAGGTAGSYGRFELDYWGAGATEALRRLEGRLEAAGAFAHGSPSLLICIPYRERMVKPMLQKNWRIELNAGKADFVIESERSRCAAGVKELVLVDEVTRYERAFAWIYGKKSGRFTDAARQSCAGQQQDRTCAEIQASPWVESEHPPAQSREQES